MPLSIAYQLCPMRVISLSLHPNNLQILEVEEDRVLRGENGATNLPEKVSRFDGNVNNKPAMSNRSYLSKLAPKGSADVSSSTSDPVVSSQITKHICPVGTIKCEIVVNQMAKVQME